MSASGVERFAADLEADLGAAVRRQVPLGPLTTYGVGGPAAVLLDAADDRALAVAAQHLARAREPIPVLIVGLGSNLLVADDGFPGLVVVLGPAFSEVAIEGTLVRAGARAKLPVVARQTAGAGLTVLGWAGYAGTGTPPEPALLAIRVLYCLVPCACYLAALVVAARYPLDEAACRRIRDELDARNTRPQQPAPVA